MENKTETKLIADFIKFAVPPNELSLCDDEIKKVFENTCYISGTAIMAQLAKNIKELNETLLKK